MLIDDMAMTTSLMLGIRLSPNSFQRVKVDGINLDDKVEQLRQEASKVTSLPTNFLELVYCGNILDDNATLRSCGLKSGVTVHVLKRKENDVPVRPRTMTEAEIQDLVLAFRTFTRHPSYRSALHRMSRPEVLENIISSTPGLREDPIAVAILRDPELLINMESVDTVRRVAERHPALAEAATHIAAAVHEEVAAAGSSNQGPSTAYSYSLEALSDEEEMDSSQSSDSQSRGNDLLGPQPSSSGITAAQLAAALASATASPAPPRASSSGASLGASSSSSGALITSEMFSQAMQQAMIHANVLPSTSSGAGTSGASANPEISADVEALTRRLSRQLQQMRELGLTDNAVNLEALQATGGDVQAAIELVFSGGITRDV